jgi:hypothetical protein
VVSIDGHVREAEYVEWRKGEASATSATLLREGRSLSNLLRSSLSITTIGILVDSM